MLGRYFPISVGICADASTVAKQLLNKIKINKLNKEINNYSKIGFGINNVFNFKDINNISNISGRIYYSKINIQL